MLYTKPSKGLASILPSQMVRSKKSFRSIAQDVTKNMSVGQSRVAKKFMRQINTDPSGIAFNRRTKLMLKAMGEAGLLKGKYRTNPSLALSHIQHAATAGAGHVSPAQSREQERAEARKEARFKDIARDRREEAEGHLSEADIHDHAPGDIHSTSMGMKEWRGARVSVGQVIDEKNKSDEPDKPLPMVEMMID